MKARLELVQGVFWVLIGASALLAALAFPLGDNAALMRVLEELTAFEQGFDQGALEAQLLSGVRAQGELPLDALAAKVSGPGVPKLDSSSGAPALAPRAQLELGSLGAVHRLGSGNATVDMASADPDLLAASLAWRLTRAEPAQAATLQSAQLSEAGASAADVQREHDIAEARLALLTARREAERTQKRHTEADELYHARVKWKAHWRAIANADEKRKETESEMQAKASALQTAERRYAELTKAADAFKPTGTAAGEQGVVEVKLEQGGKVSTWRLPAQLTLKPAPVPALTGTGFEATHAAGLWDQLEAGSAAQGIAAVRGMFTWHYRYVELGGLKLGGMTLLTLAPLGLLGLLLALIRRSRSVSGSYNPFNRPADEELPQVGLGAAPLDVLALVVLPLTASVLCAWSLIAVRQFSAGVPIVCCLGTIGLGIWAYLELSELRNLREAIRRSHSQPPAAPAE